MWHSITLWVLAVYISLFAWQSLRQRQWLWLWASVLLWLAAAVFSARVLPGIFGPKHLLNAYIPYAYITFSSLCLCLLAWRRSTFGRGWQMQQGGAYLSLLAVSGLLQHLSFLLLALLVYRVYPQGLTLYAWPSLLQQYFLQPVFWIGSQWVLMAVFYGHRRQSRMPASFFSWPQLQAGFLLMLLWQISYVLLDLGVRFAPR